MTAPSRDIIQSWIEDMELDNYVCSDCEGIHFSEWEEKLGILEARCFVETERCSLLIEAGIRSSAVLPLQGAVHFMNFDFSLLKVMLSLNDFDVPRLLLTHSLPSLHMNEAMFKDWLGRLLAEVEAVYGQLVDMDVLSSSKSESEDSPDERLH